MPSILGANTLSSGYDVDNSVRLDSASTAYLSRTVNLTQGTTSQHKFTISCWFKLGKTGQTNGEIFGAHGSSDYFAVRVQSGSRIDIISYDNAIKGRLITSQVLRDHSAWYHIVVACDSDNGSGTNRMRLYINGSEVTDFTTDTNPSSGTDLIAENMDEFNIGRSVDQVGGAGLFDGYITEFVYIDNDQLDATSFGEFDQDSPTIWKPKDVSELSQLSNTFSFYLDFEDSSNLGNDVSGNNLDFTSNNLAATDQSTDTCTNNFLTWNPLDTTDTSDLTFSEGNLKVVNATGVCRGTLAASSGKWYWEIKQITAVDASNPIQYGVADTEDSPPTHSSLNNALIAYSDNNTNKAIKKFAAGTESTITSTMGSFNNIAQNDIIQFAFDADTAKLWVGRNGTYLNSGDPANGTGEVASTNSGNFFTPCLEHAGVTYTIESNFGSPPYSISSGNTDGKGYGNFEYAVPSGFYAWNTKNLAEFG